MIETEVIVETRQELGTKTAVSLILFIFITSSLAMLGVYYSFPQMDPSEASLIKFPRDIEDAKKLGEVLSRYKKILPRGAGRILLHISIPPDICYPRVYISVYCVRVLVPFPRGFVRGLFLFCHRCLLLLPPVLPDRATSSS